MFKQKNKQVDLENKQDKLQLNTKNLLTFLTSKIIKRFDQGIRIKNLPEVQKIKGKVELVGEDGKTKKVSIADLDKELQDKNKWMYVKILEGDGFINALSRAIVNEPSFFDKDGSPARGRVDDDGRVWVNVKDGSIDAYAFQKPDGADARAKVDSNEQLVVLPFAKDSGGLIRGAADDDGTIRVKIMSEIICTTPLIQNIDLVDKALWYEIILPAKTKMFTLKLRDEDYGFYYDFTAAHVNYMTADSGERITFGSAPRVIYVQCSEADAQVAELLTWLN